MDTLTEELIQHEIDRELLLVDSAIALVRTGAARRVTLANLRLGGAVLEAARARAAMRRVRITAVSTSDATPPALVVEAGEVEAEAEAEAPLTAARASQSATSRTR